MDIILKAESVDFGYYQGDCVLEDFNLQIANGGMTGLIGPNGAGKSTALKILSGYIHQSAGSVLLKNRDISTFSNRNRAEIIAVVGQNIFTPLPFTVRQIVEMGRAVRISRFSALSAEDYLKVDTAMDEMDVMRFADKRFNELSGGEKQRIKIAAALAQEPEILLLDEPTSQLDMGHSVRLMQHLKKLNIEKNITIVLVSHDIQLISGFMKEFVLLHNGKIIADGLPDKVLKPNIIEKAYGCKVQITRDSNTDSVQVVPVVI